MWLSPEGARGEQALNETPGNRLADEPLLAWEGRIAPEELALNLERLQLAREAARTTLPAPRAATVLVVDADPGVRRQVREFLRPAGANVLDAADAEDGLRLAHEHDGPIHLLITGADLPGMNGAEMEGPISFLRPGIRVLYLSGSAEGGAVPAAIASPGKAWLQKPFSPAALRERVQELLS
jgi:CheY-like chemotaxis protein